MFLLTDQISFPGCLDFLRYWAICVYIAIVCYPGCDVMDFDIKGTLMQI